MSFIRSGSNPERLYMWIDVSGPVFFSFGKEAVLHKQKQKLHVFKDLEFTVPLKTFFRGVEKWEEEGEQPIQYKGFRIEEKYVYIDNGKEVKETTKALLKNLHSKNRREWGGRIVITYKKYKIYLWPVTWRCVVRNALNRNYHAEYLSPKNKSTRSGRKK